MEITLWDVWWGRDFGSIFNWSSRRGIQALRAGLAILMDCLGEDAIPKGTVSQLTAAFLGPNTGEGRGELQNKTMEERRQEASPIDKCLLILATCCCIVRCFSL